MTTLLCLVLLGSMMITARELLFLQQGHIILEILHTPLVDMTQAATLRGVAWIEEQLYPLPRDTLLILLLLVPAPHLVPLLSVLVMTMKGFPQGKVFSAFILFYLVQDFDISFEGITERVTTADAQRRPLCLLGLRLLLHLLVMVIILLALVELI